MEQPVGTGARRSASDPFIPDLCRGQPVLMLVLVAELLALVLSVARMGLEAFAWDVFAMTSLFVQWVMLVSAAGLCLARRHLARLGSAVAAGLSYSWVLLATAILSLAGQWLVAGGLSIDRLASGWRPDVWSLTGNVLVSSVLAGIALRYFYLSQALRQREQAALAARVQALQSRIRPHFLFNTMNSIASLIGSDPDAAEAAVEDLAALFRASLADSTIEVRWSDELDLCRRYLRIEEGRLGSRLRLEWQLEQMPNDLPIPGLSLQPLLENAIYHGIQGRPEGGVVSIRASYRDRRVEVCVDNPLPPLALAPRPGNRLALDNIGHRLRTLYGDDAGVAVEHQDERFIARLWYSPAGVS